MTPPHPLPILYACVAKGSTVLAELAASGDGGGLRSLAARCLDAAPRFHRLYTHTAGGRTYAFLMDDLLVFFAIADGSLPRHEVLVFLRRLQDAFYSAPGRRRRAAGHGPLPPLCLQDELLPVLHRLTSHDEKPPPPPSLLFASPLSDAPLNTGTPSGSDEGSRERQKKAKKGNKKWSHEAENRMEISVEGNLDSDADADLMGIGGRKSAQKLWRQHIWMILLFDLVVCSILFAIWLSVCRGFQCIAG